MAFGMLFILMYLMGGIGAGSSEWNEGTLSSKPKNENIGSERNAFGTFSMEMNTFSLDNCISLNAIHEQQMELNESHDKLDGFLWCHEAQGWLSAFSR